VNELASGVGVDRPDSRGRTGLDQIGRDLTRNPNVIIRDVQVTSDGVLIEAAAGLLDDQDPETVIRREASEELGVTIGDLERLYDVYMSPGSVTEHLHFYAAPYTPATRTALGGGIADEGEDIDILELPYDAALTMITNRQIADGKTIMLLHWAAIHGPFAHL
jgi:nudix-type nucleoside diphosphatase (YffH/AdpP family)